MGDRFYMQQKNYKPKRRLKKDIVKQVNELLGREIEGLDRLTIKSLDDLAHAVALLRTRVKFGKAYKELADEN